jgi:hypothetical protein
MKKALAALAVLVALAASLLHRPLPVARRGARERWPHRARGAVHVHTHLSHDGRGDIDAVVFAAARAGLRYVVVADHNRDPPREWEGYRDGVLVIAGQEKSTDAGHALVLGARIPFRLDGDPLSVVEDAADFGGFVVVAHPTSSHPESRWTAGFSGVAAVEIVNFAQPNAWPASTIARARGLLGHLADPIGSLLRNFRYDRRALHLWDAQLALRPIAGLLGSDSHGGLKAGPLWLPIPSHRRVFELASQHVLLGQPLRGDDGDRLAILDALRQGRGYAGLDGMADASGFAFEAREADGRALMGETLAFVEQVRLEAVVDAPPGTTLVLLRDGREIARGGPALVHHAHAPGVYRVEVYLDPRLLPGRTSTPWILSNPIYVFGEAELARRRAAAAFRREVEARDAAAPDPIDDFDGGALAASWQLDRSGAAASLAVDGGALRLDYALGPRPSHHASVCDWTLRDLSDRRGLRFRVRAQADLRFDVQVRVLEEGAPGGVRIWRHSVRARPAWANAVVPFDRLKTYDARGGRPDLARVRGIYFQIDDSHLPPGSAGSLWIDDLVLLR